MKCVIDIGCGIRPQTLVVPEYSLFVEPFPDYCQVLRDRLEGKNAAIVNAQVPGFITQLPSKSTDTVFMLDVIEHLDRGSGIESLQQSIRVAREQVVIFTPLGFMPQDHSDDETDAWGMKGMHWQTHRSGWLPEDFGAGWSVIACKHFHLVSGSGVKFDPPFGAMWAVYDHRPAASSTGQSWLARVARRLPRMTGTRANAVNR